MRKAIRLLAILALGLIICGCSSKGDNPSQAAAGVDKDLALKFLQGIQQGDKKIMYEATNLTTDIVNESREKLVHQKQNKLTEQQLMEYQHALRISGQIDFFLAKTRPMFPKTASFQIKETTVKDLTGGAMHSIHLVKITYTDKAEAMRDKTGKPVKEMVVRLQQLTRSISGRSIHAISFESKDFEKIADKDFEVLTYF
jgi:hypothetical protein